jgi:hypothetical protein
MIRRHTSLSLLLAALLPVFAFVAAPASAASRFVTIATARQLPLGTRVTLAGVATTPSGAFDSSFFDKGFAIQDETAGIFVSLQTNLNVAPRTRVAVTGVLEDHSGLLVINPGSASNVRLRGIGRRVEPVWLTTHAIGESTEGRLVLVIGRISTAPSNDLPFGFKFAVDDGSGEVQIFVNTQTGIDVSELALDQLVSVVGLSSQFEDHYEIDPRSPADISGPAF